MESSETFSVLWLGESDRIITNDDKFYVVHIHVFCRPVLDVKTKKLQFLRGAVDRKIDLVNQKRAYWARQG